MAALDNGGIFKLHKLPSKPMTAADAAQSTTSSAFPELFGILQNPHKTSTANSCVVFLEHLWDEITGPNYKVDIFCKTAFFGSSFAALFGEHLSAHRAPRATATAPSIQESLAPPNLTGIKMGSPEAIPSI